MATERHMLLQTQVDAMNRITDNSIARREATAGACRPRTRAADCRTGIEHVAAVGGRESLARAVKIKTAHLDAIPRLPDAVEHGAMTLVGRHESVLFTERRLHGERDGIHHAAPRRRLSVAERGQGVIT